jgi:DNA mismatch repair protein MSH2
MNNRDDQQNKETEVNETLLAVNFKITQTERIVGAAFLNLHERSFLVTEFQDNEHFSGLESLVIQLNNQAADSKFRVLVSLTTEIIREKLQDTLQMCEVDFAFSDNKKNFSGQMVQSYLTNLLKDNFAYMITESEMDLALGALNAGIIEMQLMS